MEPFTEGPIRPARIQVISTPIPPARLLRTVERQLQQMYDVLVSEPIPQRMVDLLARHEAACARPGGASDGTGNQGTARRVGG